MGSGGACRRCFPPLPSPLCRLFLVRGVHPGMLVVGPPFRRLFSPGFGAGPPLWRLSTPAPRPANSRQFLFGPLPAPPSKRAPHSTEIPRPALYNTSPAYLPCPSSLFPSPQLALSAACAPAASPSFQAQRPSSTCCNIRGLQRGNMCMRGIAKQHGSEGTCGAEENGCIGMCGCQGRTERRTMDGWLEADRSCNQIKRSTGMRCSVAWLEGLPLNRRAGAGAHMLWCAVLWRGEVPASLPHDCALPEAPKLQLSSCAASSSGRTSNTACKGGWRKQGACRLRRVQMTRVPQQPRTGFHSNHKRQQAAPWPPPLCLPPPPRPPWTAAGSRLRWR